MAAEALVWLALAVFVGAGPKDKVGEEKHPNGQTRVEHGVDDSGQKHGRYREFTEAGVRVVEATYEHGRLVGKHVRFDDRGRPKLTASYRDDKLHGWLREVDGRTVRRHEFWSQGEILILKSTALLSAQLATIRRTPIQWAGATDVKLSVIVSALEDKAQQREAESALRRLMAYRLCCQLPYEDMMLDKHQTALAIGAARVLTHFSAAEISNMDPHHPPNPGMPADEYELGSAGSARSNIAWWDGGKRDLVNVVDSWMDDSDGPNLDRVGHRRWCLNPRMLATGFARVGGRATMYSFDNRRKDPPDLPFIAYPPPGYLPVQLFGTRHAWSISFPQRRPASEVRVEVAPAIFDEREGTMEPAGPPLKLNHFRVDASPIAHPLCVIFRPDGAKIEPGSAYLVRIFGVQPNNQPITYPVLFFKAAGEK